MIKRTGYWPKNIFAFLFFLIVPVMNSFSGGEINPDELNQIMEEVEQMAPEIEKSMREIEVDLQQQEQNDIRNRNRILWSVPAGFPDDEFDEQSKNLHVNIPFYGKVSLGSDAYAKYKRWLDKGKQSYDINDSFFEDGLKIHDNFQDAFAMPPEVVNNLPDGQAMRENITRQFATSPIKNVCAPGLQYADYFLGRRLPGLGVYRSDLNGIGFLAANFTSGYLVFKDIKRAKLDKIKQVIDIERDEFIKLIERLVNETDKKVLVKAQQELKTWIKKNCILFGYNPCKKEVLFPIGKYLFLQRILGFFKPEQSTYWNSHPDEQFAFVKNKQGELTRSAVTPISLVSLSKIFLTPVAELSQTTSEALYNLGKSVRFLDRFFGRVHLPQTCYRLFSNVVGEVCVLTMVIKVLDGYLNDQLFNAIVASPDTWLAIVKEGKEFGGIDYPSYEQANQIMAYQERLEKKIEQALSAGRTSFMSWIRAQRATFAKISLVGFGCFVLPSLLIKGAPWLMKIIKYL